MRKLFVGLQVVTLAGLAGSLSLAQGPGGGPGGGGPGGMLRGFPVMAALDANADGVISAEEIDGAAKALKALDKNADGKLTEDETRPSFGGRGGPGGGGRNPEEMVTRLLNDNDKDKDGKLSKAEVPERMQGIFTRADADKDGFATKEELLKGMAEGGGRGFGGGAGPGGPGGGVGGPPGGFGNPGAFLDRMFEFDADKDGKLSREELQKMMDQGGGRRPEGAGNRRPPTE